VFLPSDLFVASVLIPSRRDVFWAYLTHGRPC
jgi:hypothetical protein